MTVKELANTDGFTAVALSDPDREIEGVYIGDLLSWVMGRAKANSAWITIMSNINVLAVATLADVACVVFSEGVTADEELAKTANLKGVNLIKCDLPSYETAMRLRDLI